MQSHEPEHLDRVFAALAHPVRRAILEQCGDERQSVVELARPHSMSLNAISKHIKTLESAELIGRERDGNFHRIAARPEMLQPALDWLGHHVDLWDSSLKALKVSLERNM
jgi:DNA-binding transcriptional ArsR family regulator